MPSHLAAQAIEWAAEAPVVLKRYAEQIRAKQVLPHEMREVLVARLVEAMRTAPDASPLSSLRYCGVFFDDESADILLMTHHYLSSARASSRGKTRQRDEPASAKNSIQNLMPPEADFGAAVPCMLRFWEAPPQLPDSAAK